MRPTAIEARGVSKRFVLRHNRAGALKVQFLGLFDASRRQRAEEFWAVRDVWLRIYEGESVGLVGRNGSGKSTLLKLVAAIHRPTAGSLLVARRARIASMIELGIGFHPELTGQENVFLNAAIQGLSREEIQAIYPSVVEYSGLRHFIDLPLKTYSSGMHMRLGFAVAANLNPDILLLDEIFAVGDADFQQRCMQTIRGFLAGGKTVLFVSHSAPAVKEICQRVCVLENGRVVFDGDVNEGLSRYAASISGTEGADVASAAERAGQMAGDEEPDRAWHRIEVGGQWDEAGAWQFDFLRRQGLEPHHFLLDVGCGSLSGAVRLLPYLEPRRYWGFEVSRALFEAGVLVEVPRAGVREDRGHFIVNQAFDFSESPVDFDMAIANSFFRRLPLNAIPSCVASVVRKLKPGGRFFATWLDNPDPLNFGPIERPDGTLSRADVPPYHYTFAQLAQICELVGARAERMAEAGHPRGEDVLVIARR